MNHSRRRRDIQLQGDAPSRYGYQFIVYAPEPVEIICFIKEHPSDDSREKGYSNPHQGEWGDARDCNESQSFVDSAFDKLMTVFALPFRTWSACFCFLFFNPKCSLTTTGGRGSNRTSLTAFIHASKQVAGPSRRIRCFIG